MSKSCSDTNFPFMCVRDEVCMFSFRTAIHAVERPRDVTLNVGAGSGIMSFPAVKTGGVVKARHPRSIRNRSRIAQ